MAIFSAREVNCGQNLAWLGAYALSSHDKANPRTMEVNHGYFHA